VREKTHAERSGEKRGAEEEEESEHCIIRDCDAGYIASSPAERNTRPRPSVPPLSSLSFSFLALGLQDRVLASDTLSDCDGPRDSSLLKLSGKRERERERERERDLTRLATRDYRLYMLNSYQSAFLKLQRGDAS